jgi:uncharacterized protein (TIGR04141 family)
MGTRVMEELGGAVDAGPDHVEVVGLDDLLAPTAGGESPGRGVAVDLTAILLRSSVRSPSAAVTGSVGTDETSVWYVADGEGRLVEAPASEDAEVSVLVRSRVSREPAWKAVLRDLLGVQADHLGGPAMSSGAVVFVRTGSAGKEHLVAWCFGQGSRWIRRSAASPRFGLLAALNALAGSTEASGIDGVGVTGASLAARDGNLRRARLTAAVPTTSGAIPRLDTLADVLMAARVRTGHDELGWVSGGRSLQFSAAISSLADFRRLSGLVVELAGQSAYRKANGWIDYIVPEADDSVVEAVMDRVWRGEDDGGRPVEVEISWWEDLREAGSDHPVTHWRLGNERRQKRPVRNLSLTWPAVQGKLRARLGQVPGHQALATDLRFFSDDEEQQGRCPVAELLSAQVDMAGVTYVLIDGEVCRVDARFLEALDRQLQDHVIPVTLVPYKLGEHEDSYNARAAADAGMLLLDKKDIRPSGETQIEPCDLLGRDASLYHVKRHTNATGISHVVSQAVASATVLLREPQSQDKLAGLIDAGPWDETAKGAVKDALRRMPGTASRVPVNIVIVGEWTNPTITSLSLLSRLALRTAVVRLGDLGFPIRIMLVSRAETR